MKNKKSIIFLIIMLNSFLGCSLLFAAGIRGKVLEIKAVKVDEPPKLDGKIDDTAWIEAASYGSKLTGFLNVNSTKIVDYQPVVFIAYDEKCLYIAAKVYVPDIKKITANSTDDFFDWKDDLIQIFLEPKLDGRYIYVTFTSNGKSNHKTVKASGSIGKNAWVCETAIPWEILDIYPKEGSAIGINVCGLQNASGESWIAWAPTYGAFTNSNKFGYLVLGQKLVKKRLLKTVEEDDF